MTPAQVIRDKLPHDLAIPVLPSRSLPGAIAFFARLGFEGEILGQGDAYAILTRGDLELHFVLHAALVPAEHLGGLLLESRRRRVVIQGLLGSRSAQARYSSYGRH